MSTAPLPLPIVLSRNAAVIALLALIGLCLVWELWLAPTGRGSLALKALPLTVALPGLLKRRMYTYRWLSLLVWVYVLEGLVRATSEHGRGALLAMFEVVIGLVLFAACALHVRWRLRHPTPAAETAP